MTAVPELERQPGEIIYHFDVDQHSIPLKQFVDTARASQTAIEGLNEPLFDKKVRFELRVKTPETGGLIEVLGLVVLGGGGSVWAFLGTDIGKAYILGLTGEEPAHWAEKLGKRTRKALPEKNEEQAEALMGELVPESVAAINDLSAEMLAELLIAFLAVNIEKLRKIGITPEKFRKSFEARNAIYRACLENSEVRGLSFDRTYDFPLKRSDFPAQISQIPDSIDEADDEKITWSVESVDIVVNSPNWKRDGRKWQAATNKFQDIAFSIEDENFWHHVGIKDIHPDIRDNMRVQWAYPTGHSKPHNVQVLKVIAYNGKDISAPLTDTELQHVLEEAHLIEPDHPDLFNDLHKNQNTTDDGGDN
jgi:hypothetical protein